MMSLELKVPMAMGTSIACCWRFWAVTITSSNRLSVFWLWPVPASSSPARGAKRFIVFIMAFRWVAKEDEHT